MRTVFQNNEIAHVFASQTQSHGRASSIYFDNGTIYSYGRHFPMAAFSKDGKTVYFTTRSYSNSTAKHLNYTGQALRHFPMVYCYNPEQAARGTHYENLEAWNKSAQWIARKLPTARKPEKYLSEIARERAQFETYCDHFKIRITKKMQAKYPYVFIQSKDESEAARKKQAAALRKQQREEKKRAAERHAKELREFRAFERERLYAHNGLDYLRYNVQEDRVETSQGIRVERHEAERLLKVVRIAIERGGCTDCGTVNHIHKIKSISAETFVAGCHTIPIEEILEIGRQMGV